MFLLKVSVARSECKPANMSNPHIFGAVLAKVQFARISYISSYCWNPSRSSEFKLVAICCLSDRCLLRSSRGNLGLGKNQSLGNSLDLSKS